MNVYIGLFAAATAAATAHAVVVPDTTLTPNQLGGYDISWFGVTGHTYFVEFSSDLQVWTTLPLWEQGFDAQITWGLTSSEGNSFWRIWATDFPTSTPLLEDFDGDGVSTADELAAGTNPVDTDPDQDGLTFAQEQLLGTNGFVKATPDASVALRLLSPVSGSR